MLAHDEQQATLPSMAYRALLADFRAAVWCEAHAEERDDAVLGRNFHKIHDSFLRAIDRSRPGLFRNVNRGFLLEVLRKWIALYLHAVEDVRLRFPRTDISPDLIAGGRNWSERLGIAYEGLDRLDIVSRYAEYWAERAVTWATTGERGKGVYETFDQRFAFVGSSYYHLAEDLVYAKRIMFFDQAGNGITAFDMRDAFAEVANPADIERRCAEEEWIVAYIKPDARAALWSAAR